MKTLAQIIEEQKKANHVNGMFGIEACKESIKFKQEYYPEYNGSLYLILEDLVNRANNEAGFNRTMVYACWLMINEQ